MKKRIGHLDPLIATAESAITLLQERRAALISAAVTGKIDVRGAEVVAEVPDQVFGLDLAAVVAGVVIARLAAMPTFGRVKLQKILYLAEAHAGINEIDGSYLRKAAGPRTPRSRPQEADHAIA